MLRRFLQLLPLLALVFLETACTFNFELTSQRTALENQVMGSYRELDDDLVLSSSVRAPGNKPQASISQSKRKALDARQNQEFNRDDIDELKDKHLLGETATGTVSLLPSSLSAAKSVAADVKLAQQLADEENRDRAAIWQRIIESNENLSDADLPEVRKTYAKMQRESLRPGQWYQRADGSWVKKDGEAETETL